MNVRTTERYDAAMSSLDDDLHEAARAIRWQIARSSWAVLESRCSRDPRDPDVWVLSAWAGRVRVSLEVEGCNATLLNIWERNGPEVE